LRQQGLRGRTVHADAHADERGHGEGVPRLADQQVERERQRVRGHGGGHDLVRGNAVDEPAGDEARGHRGQGAGRDRGGGYVEGQAAGDMEVQHEERSHQTVAEEVHEHSGLDEPDVARQVRVEAARI